MIRKSYGKAAIDGKVLLLVDLHKGGNVKVTEEEQNASQKRRRSAVCRTHDLVLAQCQFYVLSLEWVH